VSCSIRVASALPVPLTALRRLAERTAQPTRPARFNFFKVERLQRENSAFSVFTLIGYIIMAEFMQRHFDMSCF